MKTWKILATAASVAVLAACGGGGDSGGAIPLAVKMGTTPAVIPTVPEGASSVTVFVSVAVQSYAATVCLVAKDNATGEVLGKGGCEGSSGTLGSDTTKISFPVNVFANVPVTVGVYVGAKQDTATLQDTITLNASCAVGTAPNKAGVCSKV